MPHAIPAVPWRVGDATLLYCTSVAAVALLALCWFGVSGSADLGTQVAWMNVGVLGVVVGGTGNVIWLLAGRRAVGQRRRALMAGPLATTAPVGSNPSDALTHQLVAASTMTLFHRRDCLLVAGKSVVVARRDDHVSAGRGPCGVCLP